MEEPFSDNEQQPVYYKWILVSTADLPVVGYHNTYNTILARRKLPKASEDTLLLVLRMLKTEAR